MTGLLFAAFAFFTVAQAGSVRNGGQSAADAAALAAAQDDRDELFDGFLDSVIGDGDDEGEDGEGDEDEWQDWLDGIGSIAGDGCGEADRFAGRNRADVLSCEHITRGSDDGYTVRIQTRFDTGRTFVPGTDNKKAKASATAVIQPRCDLDDSADGIDLTCDGEDFTIDPDDDIDLEPSDLFDVVLVD